jgi:hypothetical protein
MKITSLHHCAGSFWDFIKVFHNALDPYYRALTTGVLTTGDRGDY